LLSLLELLASAPRPPVIAQEAVRPHADRAVVRRVN